MRQHKGMAVVIRALLGLGLGLGDAADKQNVYSYGASDESEKVKQKM